MTKAPDLDPLAPPKASCIIEIPILTSILMLTVILILTFILILTITVRE
jgi:hypothetical protein